MKWLFPSTLFVLYLLSSSYSSAFEKLSKNQMKDISAQSGITMAVDSATIYQHIDSLKISAVDNRDPFGNLTSPDEGYISMQNFQTLAVFDSVIKIDVGLYQAPDEHLVATDIGKRNGIGDYKYEHQYVSDRTLGILHTFQIDPYYWPIGDEIERPLEDKYAVVQVSATNFASEFNTDFTMKFRDKELSHVALSGITMPEFVHDGVPLPGTVLTLYPDGCSINMEVRTRLTIDELKIGDGENPDLRISGTHFGEAFAAELPDHLEDTGDADGTGIDSSGWGDDFKAHMYSGYFLIGNLNQVDFNDRINDMQLYRSLGKTKNDDDYKLVQLVANPFSINFGRQNGTGNPIISLRTGLAGSIRIESLQGWNGTDFGPVAVDGIRVKHCVVEFPGGYKHEDGSFKGRIHPDQLEWLNSPPNNL